MTSNRLPGQIQRTAGIPNGLRIAKVTAVSGSTITLSINGSEFSEGVGSLMSYTPQVGNVVAVFRQDSTWLILGWVRA